MVVSIALILEASADLAIPLRKQHQLVFFVDFYCQMYAEV
jgi:hypothetical protein